MISGSSNETNRIDQTDLPRSRYYPPFPCDRGPVSVYTQMWLRGTPRRPAIANFEKQTWRPV